MFKAEYVKRTSIEAFADITLCLFEREFKARFGAYKHGWIWMLTEPSIHVITFIIILSRLQIDNEGFREIPFFVLSGVIPFFLVRSITKGVLSCLKGSKAMFAYPMIQPMHIVASKALFETFNYSLAFVAIYSITSLFFWGNEHNLDVLSLLSTLLTLCVFATGVGVTLMVIREFKPSVEKFTNICFRPLYFLSGVFYSINIVPEQFRFLYEYNPIAHIIELTRVSVSGTQPVYGDLVFVFKLGLFFQIVGLTMYILHKDKLKSP